QGRITALEAEIDEIVAEIARLRTVTSNENSSFGELLVLHHINFDGYSPVVFRRLLLLDWGFNPRRVCS
ncbi:MAG: hypothetical protein AAF349_13785, partial [Cyanobacteria bacterium P01_A01_bin.68]